jgi:hypothetical protein
MEVSKATIVAILCFNQRAMKFGGDLQNQEPYVPARASFRVGLAHFLNLEFFTSWLSTVMSLSCSSTLQNFP